jgi:hypothetical protein
VRAFVPRRFVAPLVFALAFFSASTAQAQKIPDAAVWWVGASLLAPFLAIPAKLGILRVLRLKAPVSRLWMLGAIEWLVWFPIGFVLLRSGASSPPIVVLCVFALVVWLHKIRVANDSWGKAIYLSLPVPILAIMLPFLAFMLHQSLE